MFLILIKATMQVISIQEIEQVFGGDVSHDTGYSVSVGTAVGFVAAAIGVGVAAPVAAGLVGGLALASMASSAMAMYYAIY